MTIAAAFKCTDGAVLCADSRWTGATKRPGPKLWWFPAGNAGTLGLAVAGDAPGLRRARFEIERDLKRRAKASPTLTFDEIFQIADDAVYRVWHREIKGEKDAVFLLLIAIRTPDGVVLLENQNGKTLFPLDADSQCVGSESSALGRYLEDWLFDASLPMSRARIVAAYMLNQAKEYDPYVGGASQILLFPADMNIQPRRLERDEIRSLEDQLEEIRESVRELIVYEPGMTGVDMNAETAARRKATRETAVGAAHAPCGKSCVVRESGKAWRQRLFRRLSCGCLGNCSSQ